VLELGGFTPLTTTDWPGKLAAVAFVQGCPWHCRYCHNPELQPRGVNHGPPWRDVLATLERRVGLLDGLVFSGGEPTLEPDLAQAVDDVRALGLKVGLHTAGIYPERLAALLPALDWVGFDLKSDAAGYDALTTRRDSAAPVRRALDHLLASGVDHEIRTTYHPEIVGDEALLAMARQLKAVGAATWVLQRWQPFDDSTPDLVASWHWPDEALLQALRQDMPALTLR
jgi:pyruvate formate lyase activating enzyme